MAQQSIREAVGEWRVSPDMVMAARNLENKTGLKTAQEEIDRFEQLEETPSMDPSRWFEEDANDVLISTDNLKRLHWLARAQDSSFVRVTVPRGFYPFHVDFGNGAEAVVAPGVEDMETETGEGAVCEFVTGETFYAVVNDAAYPEFGPLTIVPPVEGTNDRLAIFEDVDDAVTEREKIREQFENPNVAVYRIHAERVETREMPTV